MDIQRHRTAMHRSTLSRPVASALADGVISAARTVFDYGCGRGGDVVRLRSLGVDAVGWDPVHQPHEPKRASEVVNLGYVVNVIEDPRERRAVLADAWALASHVLIVSSRTLEEDRAPIGVPLGDGLVTGRRTFQKLFSHAELGEWITEVTGERPYAAAPGIYYLFRDADEGQVFLRSRVGAYRPRMRIDPHTAYEANAATLRPLLEFMTRHARPPRRQELPAAESAEITDAVGSFARGVRLIRSVTDDAYWEEVAGHRRSELLVTLALGRFREQDLLRDPIVRADVTGLFGSTQTARAAADRLLISSSDASLRYVNALASKVGRVSRTSLYAHPSALPELPPILRVFEGCARLLAGASVGVNIIRLSFVTAEVEYRVYDDFDTVAHPTLTSSATVAIGDLDVRWTHYLDAADRPVLHRKEEFISSEHPCRPMYAALSRAEQRHGLYDEPQRITTAAGWASVLHAHRLAVAGHRLRRITGGEGEADVRPGG
jgi:DNA phosphorothioation-associated putative methyltransferase